MIATKKNRLRFQFTKKEEESLREFCITNEMNKYPDDGVEKLCEVSRVIPNEKFHQKSP